jgi:hypothetical protein
MKAILPLFALMIVTAGLMLCASAQTAPPQSTQRYEYAILSVEHQSGIREIWFLNAGHGPGIVATLDSSGGRPPTDALNGLLSQLGGQQWEHGSSYEISILNAAGSSGWGLVSHETYRSAGVPWEEWRFARSR